MDRILGEDGPPHKRTRFTLNEYNGHKLFEIREFYLRGGEYNPTRKGVNLNRDKFMELKRVLDKDHDAIMEFLRIGHIPEAMLRYQQAQEEAKQKNFRLAHDVKINEVNRFRDEHLFHVSHQGNTDVVELNTSHAFAKAISIEEIANSTPEEIRELFAAMMASYARARSLLLGAAASNPEILFEQAEFDWHMFLSNYIDEVDQ